MGLRKVLVFCVAIALSSFSVLGKAVADSYPPSPGSEPRKLKPTQVATPAGVKQGKINVASRGTWAEVYWQGKNMGSTPMTLQLPLGTHKLKFVNPDEGIKKTITVTIIEGKTETLFVDMLH